MWGHGCELETMGTLIILQGVSQSTRIPLTPRRVKYYGTDLREGLLEVTSSRWWGGGEGKEKIPLVRKDESLPLVH